MYDYDNNTQYAKNQVKHLVGGYFEYFKGGVVKLDCIATDWETKEIMVVYSELPNESNNNNLTTYVRPFSLFFGYIYDENGEQKSRFNYLGKSDIKKIIHNVAFDNSAELY